MRGLLLKIIIATGNKGKVKEIKELMNGFEIIPYSDIIKPFDIIEDGSSFKENAIIKAKAVFNALKDDMYIVLADDSGICVPIFNNEPGIYSSRYAGEGATDKDNLKKLINKLKNNSIKRTKAYYTCAIAIATKSGLFCTHGFMHGEVIDEARGENGFGYDPIFIPNGFNKTLGELEDDIKNSFSHRAKAIELAKIILQTF